MPTLYEVTPANNGERTVLLVGWLTKAVFVGPDHQELAKRVAELLNRDEASREKATSELREPTA